MQLHITRSANVFAVRPWAIRFEARCFRVWQMLQLGHQTAQAVAEAADLSVDQVRHIMRKRGWLFQELPQRPTMDVDEMLRTGLAELEVVE